MSSQSGRNVVVSRQTPLPQPTPVQIIGRNPALQLQTPVPQPPPVIITFVQYCGGGVDCGPFVIQGSGFQSADSRPPTVTVDMGPCGKQQFAPASGDWSNEAITLRPFLKLAHDKDPTVAYITVTTSGGTSTVHGVDYELSDQLISNISIAAYTPHLVNDGGIGLSEGSSVVYSSSANRVSTNPNDPRVEGDDIIGYGIRQLNLFGASATITAVSSYMDPLFLSGSQPSDAFRGAYITQQPQNSYFCALNVGTSCVGTKVHWYYSGGESISYSVQLKLFGAPYGRRSLDSLPKMGFCSDEQ